jgi:Mrp family chromosome partitioning ATPase
VRQQIDGQAADAQSDAIGLRQGRAQIQAAIRTADVRLTELVQIGPQYRELIRRRAVVEAAYQDQAKNAEEAQFQTALTRSHANVRVIQPAEPPLRGSSGRAAIVVAGLVLAGVVALAVIVLLAAASQTMLTPRDLEQKVQTPTLLAIPRGLSGEGFKPVAGEGRVLRPQYLSVDEAKLLLRLLSSVAPGPSRVIQLIAAGDGAGVSKLALDIAIIASAQYGRRVLLMDIEPPKDQSASAALADRGAVLSALPGRSRIMQVDGSSLYVTVPFGKQQLRGPALDWRAVLATARRDFDLVVIDSPALERSSSGVVISGLVDMTLAVVEAEQTRAAAVRNLIDRIDGAGGQVIGAILNKRRFYIPRFIYSRL